MMFLYMLRNINYIYIYVYIYRKKFIEDEVVEVEERKEDVEYICGLQWGQIF